MKNPVTFHHNHDILIIPVERKILTHTPENPPVMTSLEETLRKNIPRIKTAAIGP